MSNKDKRILEKEALGAFFAGKYSAKEEEPDEDASFYTDLKRINRRSVMFAPDVTQYFDDFIEDKAHKMISIEEDSEKVKTERMNMILN